MRGIHLFQLVLLICVYVCSCNSDKHLNGTDLKQQGLYIENSPRRGMQYFDSTKTEYNYRYYTMTITNDSIYPIRLKIKFSKTEFGLSKVFLLPRPLTPEEYNLIDVSIPEELIGRRKRYITKPYHLNKILNPTEKYVLTCVVLTNSKNLEPTTPFNTGLSTTKENASKISLELKINEFLRIPCGQFSYINN